MFDIKDYGYDIKDYGYIGASTLGWGPVDYTEEQIDKMIREENVLMETKELTKEELEKIAAEIRLAAGLDNPIKETKKGGNNEKVVETPKVAKTPKTKMEFFEVETNSTATIKGIKYKGRTGIDISDFSFKICTASNQAVYKHVRVFKGGENDPWKYWGKFRGVFKEPVNGRREAEFEFYVIGGRVLVSYWKSEPYIRIARKLAAHAINKLNKVLK